MANVLERIQIIPGTTCPVVIYAPTRANLPFDFSAFVFRINVS